MQDCSYEALARVRSPGSRAALPAFTAAPARLPRKPLRGRGFGERGPNVFGALRLGTVGPSLNELEHGAPLFGDAPAAVQALDEALRKDVQIWHVRGQPLGALGQSIVAQFFRGGNQEC